jgi:phosphoglycerol transferase MdoB-like AlkP superfamily enzyme
MPKAMSTVFSKRYGPVVLMILVNLVISFITRFGLALMAHNNLNGAVIFSFFTGMVFDIAVALFVTLPLVFYCWLQKDSVYRRKWQRIILYAFFILGILFLILNAIGEFLFWDEFSSRYNFIAVDYLIYTNEVLNNILQSYNIPLIAAGLLLASTLLFLLVRKKIDLSLRTPMRFPERTRYFVLYILLAGAGYFFVNEKWKNISENRYVNELAGNGLFGFGHAFWHNELDYKTFYPTVSDSAAFSLLKASLLMPNQTYTYKDSLFSIERTVRYDSPERRLNVVLISIESMSASFLRHFGETKNITPHLDSLIGQSLFFENFYASGTRTVRGLEALSLAVPPTPGQSIIKRMPTVENFFTIGQLFKARQYDTKYIYGGNAFFDNMGSFFGNNGYEVIDIRDIKKDVTIHHETAWGVADEDLFTEALLQMDASARAGKNFFNHIMTVSNHRPYTYPDGRIDIRSGGDQEREGAIKYTDWAIDNFLKRAAAKPWFGNTVFVIVADHCANAAGKTEVPIAGYHIPCWVYAPGLVQPKIETKPMGQIDLAPTICGLLRLQYSSKFFGNDIYTVPAGKERLFVGTYENIGFIENNTMVVLSPQKKTEVFKVNLTTGQMEKQDSISAYRGLINEAISNYQSASWLYNNNEMKYTK